MEEEKKKGVHRESIPRYASTEQKYADDDDDDVIGPRLHDSKVHSRMGAFQRVAHSHLQTPLRCEIRVGNDGIPRNTENYHL